MRERGDRKKEVEKEIYFREKKKDCQTGFANMKIVQVNKTEVFLFGGIQNRPSLLSRDYEPEQSVLKIDVVTGELMQKAEMLRERKRFGGISIGHLVYILGGYSDTVNVNDCERYDILRDTW